jgi:hypothetical protein
MTGRPSLFGGVGRQPAEVYDGAVSTLPRRSALPGLLAAAALAAGCAVPESRRLEPPVANALPEQDPATRGTVQGQAIPISQAEQMVVRLGSEGGNVVIRQVVSPALTAEQEEEVRRAFARGDWKRQNPLPPSEGTWPETIVPSK